MDLFGVELTGEVRDDEIVTDVMILVELLDPATNQLHLRVISTRMPVWKRIGMAQTILATDIDDVRQAFEED